MARKTAKRVKEEMVNRRRGQFIELAGRLAIAESSRGWTSLAMPIPDEKNSAEFAERRLANLRRRYGEMLGYARGEDEAWLLWFLHGIEPERPDEVWKRDHQPDDDEDDDADR